MTFSLLIPTFLFGSKEHTLSGGKIVFLTIKKVLTACITEKPEVPKAYPTEEQLQNFDSWKENDFICKNLILNNMVDDLYDYYSMMSIEK